MNSDHPDKDFVPTPQRSRRVIPLEDIVAPLVFIVTSSGMVMACHRWLGLPFWGACLAGLFLSPAVLMMLVWLFTKLSR